MTATGQCAGAPQLVEVELRLLRGGTHRLRLPEGSPWLAQLLAHGTPSSARGDALPARLLQMPLANGAAALSFSSADIAGLRVFPASAAGDVPVAASAMRASPPHRNTAEPATYAGEGHLGGYMPAVPDAWMVGGDSHHGDPRSWCPELWRWMHRELGVASVLDAGCGEGHAAAFFRELGCEVLGVDGSRQARWNSAIADAHVVHDFVTGPLVPDRDYELVWCCGLVEQVEERYTHNFLATLASASRYVLLTHALPGQPGYHHVNLQPPSYWIDKLTRLGFALDEELTATTRKLAGAGTHYDARGLAFVREEAPARAHQASTATAAEVGAGKAIATSDRPVARDVATGIERATDEALPIHDMEVARIGGDAFFLFNDLFVHPSQAKVVAVSPWYDDDWDPAAHGIDYDAVDLVAGSLRVRGRCLRHRLESWEPCMLLEFEHSELEALLAGTGVLACRIETGHHAKDFALATAAAPAYGVAMSLVVRDENRWIRHFLEYYLTCMKAEHVFVYDNGTADRDELLALLRPCMRAGTVTYIPWSYRWRNRKRNKMIGQPAQEAHSLARFANCRWLGFLDVDELLRIPGHTLPSFLARFDGAAVDGLSFGLRWFAHCGATGFEEVADPPLTFLHARRDELGRKRQKLLVKPAGVRFLRLHWLEDGKRELPIDDTDIFFHHYLLRRERFDEGKQRGGDYDDYMLRFRDRLRLQDARTRPGSAQAWVQHIERAFADAEAERSRLPPEALAVAGMCGRYTRHFYNNLCSFDGCRLLEIGSYKGASICAAAAGNRIAAVCIDDWSIFDGSRAAFEQNLARFRAHSTIALLEQDAFKVDAAHLGPFDVYFYDGDHSERSQYLAIERFRDSLADLAVVVVDDWNWAAVQRGTRSAVRDLGVEVVYQKQVVLPDEDVAGMPRHRGKDTWWNGICVMLVRKGASG